MIRDLLLQLTTYPVPTPDGAFAAVLPLAKRFGASVTAALCEVHIPPVSNFLADKLVGADQAIARENAISRDSAQHLAQAFVAQVPDAYRGDQIAIDSASFIRGDEVARQARLFDLVVLPVFDGAQHEGLAEALVFGSGRPVQLLPVEGGSRSWCRVVSAGTADGPRRARLPTPCPSVLRPSRCRSSR